MLWKCKKINNVTKEDLQERFPDLKIQQDKEFFYLRFKPKKWYDAYMEKYYDDKIRSIFKDVEFKVSRSFNGFIYSNIGRLITSNGFYLRQTTKKVWIGYDSEKTEHKINYDSAIKRILVKGISAGLIPTMLED